MKRPAKHSAINIHDFPRNNFSVYWEYGVVQDTAGAWSWWLRFIEYATGKVVLSDSGACVDEESGRRHVQKLIAAEIGRFRRETPLEEVTPEKAAQLRDKFDEYRRVATTSTDPKEIALAFSGIDRIRGMLKANGYQLQEQMSIGYQGQTELLGVQGS